MKTIRSRTAWATMVLAVIVLIGATMCAPSAGAGSDHCYPDSYECNTTTTTEEPNETTTTTAAPTTTVEAPTSTLPEEEPYMPPYEEIEISATSTPDKDDSAYVGATPTPHGAPRPIAFTG